MTTYIYREENDCGEKFEAESDQAAEQHGQQLLENGDWNQWSASKTFRVRGDVYRPGTDEDGDPCEEHVASLIAEFDPPEPKCTEPEHDWQEGGPAGEWPVTGHGGGVIIRAYCTHCRVIRVRDTWDTDPSNGEVMETVEYVTSPVFLGYVSMEEPEGGQP